KGKVLNITKKIVNGEGKTWYQFDGGYIWSDYIYTGLFSTVLNYTSASMYKGSTKTLKVTVKGPSTKATWSSSDKSIATVSSSGVVTAVKSGSCKITATANGIKATCTVTVKNPTIKLDVTSASISKGTTKTLKATVKGASTKVTWSSSNKSIATVSSSGVVKGVKTGSCTITATANGVKATCSIKVINPTISLNLKQLHLYSDECKNLVATVNGASTKVTWSSSNKSIATVSDSGVVKGVKSGTCTITAAANGVKTTCTVKVEYVKIIKVIKSFDKLNNTISSDKTTEVFGYLYDGSIDAVQIGQTFYYQFKKGTKAVRVKASAFTGKCSNDFTASNNALTDSLNAQISTENSTSSVVVYPLYASGKVYTRTYQINDKSNLMNANKTDTYHEYYIDISCFKASATLTGNKITLKSEKYKSDKTIRFKYVDKIDKDINSLSGIKVSTIESQGYGRALSRTLVDNEKFTPSFGIRISDTGSKTNSLYLQQYEVACYGYIDQPKGKYLEDYIKIAFDIKDVFGIIAAPQIEGWKSLKTIYGFGKDLSTLINSSKPTESGYEFNGEPELLSWEKDQDKKEKTVYSHSAMFSSPVKLLTKASYYVVKVDLNKKPLPTSKFNLEFSISQ
ncbi:MAG: Ig-like domain-containing protein, partial [Acutalibacteraceae bacterium]